jgi:hypothetical protein
MNSKYKRRKRKNINVKKNVYQLSKLKTIGVISQLIVHTRIFTSHHLFVGRTSRWKTLRLGKMQYP